MGRPVPAVVARSDRDAPLDDPGAICYQNLERMPVGPAGRAGREVGGGTRLTEAFVGKLGYLGIALVLVLGGLGLPVPEEAPIIIAAVFSKSGKLSTPLAFASCLSGVLLGDFIVYFLGYVYGDKVTSLRLTRKFLTRARETQIQGYFHRHGFRILILGRFAVGFRTAAYLTAGILKLPVLRLFLIDLVAATLSTSLMFVLGYVFAHQIQTSLDNVKYWVAAGAAVVAGWLVYRYYKARLRAGLPIGPRVLDSADMPLPPDDLHARSVESRAVASSAPPPVPEPATLAPPPVPNPAPTEPGPHGLDVEIDPARQRGGHPDAALRSEQPS